MRKLKLLMAACALVGGVAVGWAQTDVTSTYITNPGFEGESATFFTLQSGRVILKPQGWSVQYEQTTSGDKNTMSWIAESQTNDGATWNAHTGKSYMLRSKFANLELYLRQTMVNLLPGSYTLSFYAAGYTDDSSKNSLTVSVAGQSQAVTMSTTDASTYNKYDINFTITEATPYATIEVKGVRNGNLFKMSVDDFTLTYDGSSYYSTILTAAQALYDDNADWAENGLSDFAAAITANSGKETVADKNAAIVALKTAMATFKDANSVDMTSRITNPNFDSNISGWTTTGGDGNAFQRQTSSQTNFTGGFLEKWRNGWNGGYNQKDFDVSQTLSSMPNGEYTIKAAIIAVMQGSAETIDKTYTNKFHGGPFYKDDEHGVWFYAESGENNDKAWANTQNESFSTETGGGEYKTATVKVENGNLKIGFKGIGSAEGGTSIGTYANWIACDNWTLSYFGFDPSTLKAQISDLKVNVQAIIDGDEVPAAVKTSLQNTLNDLVETPETKTVLDAAVSTLESAISAANATKEPYAAAQALIDFVTAEKNNSNGTKTTIEAAITTATTVIETRTTADDLTSDYNTLEEARQTYVTSGAQPTTGNVFDYTFKIADAAVTGTGWSASGTASGQQYTGAPDNKYFDCGWNSSLNKNQVVESLPAGYYTLKAATRAKASEVTSANIYVNQTRTELNRSTDTNRDGNTGGTLGNGWSWTEVNFELRAAGDVTVGFYGQTTGQGWAGADDFHLYYKGNAVDDETAEALIATVVSGKMNATVASTQTSALTAFESAQTLENYDALEVAIAAASASKTAYTKLKGELDKMDATFDALVTNVYSTTDYATNYTDIKDSYDDGSISTDDANSYSYGSRVTGAMPAIMLSSWKVGETAALEDASLYMNTWSTEGISDGSDITIPFYEYYVSNTNALAEKTFTATVEGLTSGKDYLVTAKVRVRQQDNQTKADDDVTFQVNDEEVATAADGTQSDVRPEMYYKTVRAFGKADNDGKLTIKVVVKNDNHISWLAFKDVHYSEVTTPTDDHKSALASAISTAESKTIGFAEGEYAPYTNIAARKALAAAKAIDVDVNTDYEVVAATTALTGATWDENEEEMNAVSDELFNGTEYGAAGWTRTQTWNNTSTGVYSVPAGTMNYGEVAYHEMPLEGNTVYKLTFGHRRWDSGNADNGGKVSVLNAGGEGLALTAYSGTNEQSLQNEYYFFRTGEAGNYTFTVTAASGRLTFGNVVIKKAVAENVTIAEDASAYPDYQYANVTIARAFNKGWNAVCLPFDTEAFDGAEIAEFTGESAEGNNVTLEFTKVSSFEANKPYLVYFPAAVAANKEFEGVIVDPAEVKTEGTAFDFMGTYIVKDIAEGDWVVSGGALKKASTTISLKPTRTYFTPKVTAARIAGFTIDGDETTGIVVIDRKGQMEIATDAYNLSGQKMTGQLKKGIYIVNGKKTVIK